MRFSCTRWKSSWAPGLQQTSRFLFREAGVHIAGELSGIITMKRLLYHNLQRPFNPVEMVRQRKRLRLPENGLALGVD